MNSCRGMDDWHFECLSTYKLKDPLEYRVSRIDQIRAVQVSSVVTSYPRRGLKPR